MRSNRTSRVTLLSVILVLGSFTAFITPTVGAESTSGETTFFFHSTLEGGFDQNRPTKENLSAWPATLKTDKNIQFEWLSSLIFYALAQMEEFGDNESYDYGGFDELLDMACIF